jgi:arginine-tRNA-protein transferase
MNRRLPLYLSAPHACSYLPDRRSSTLFADPAEAMDMSTYSELLRFGFRRSGRIVYAPRCQTCRQCMSLRIPVAQFSPRRNQRRILKANRNIEIRSTPARFDKAHFTLYQRYTQARHQDGEMANATPDEYMDFLHSAWCDTVFVEFLIDGQLVAVAVTDRPADGLSAVYTFFEPALAARSLGTFAILSQIEMAAAEQRPYLYLGYWIHDSRKMAYKADFRPLEAWFEGRWQRFDVAERLPRPADSGEPAG